eukprot:NODE_13275_length_482_cov_24.325905_g12982_i0.p1 GENE.NODE_13275_length_482_cov_24.325905_g12982_i0~~NODE_13275_length_482_cov_24.325905_g12982_i0.p1  ORF type:complete len:119 (-),score=23.90 NODE_13275_length_482_cov_24.325905_g12982_i0:3-359(-)
MLVLAPRFLPALRETKDRKQSFQPLLVQRSLQMAEQQGKQSRRQAGFVKSTMAAPQPQLHPHHFSPSSFIASNFSVATPNNCDSRSWTVILLSYTCSLGSGRRSPKKKKKKKKKKTLR